MDISIEKKLREKTIQAAVEYYKEIHGKKNKFTPGNKINYAGRVFDESEISNLIESALDFWLTEGRFAEKFEKEFSKYLGVKHCLLVNSGSSANLIAFMALTSKQLGERKVNKGDEVITVAAGFPTTIAPIVQYGAVPVFVDVTLPGYNIDCSQLEKAVSSKTKAVMVAHTLGNPFDLHEVKAFCKTHGLWLIEDNCDALGSKYCLNGSWEYTGTIGDIGTSSFYPPHHMTMGEGGAVYTNSAKLKKIIKSFRDWGRDCYCASGHDNTCKRRFGQQFGELPFGYDHKYVYTHFGYNLKVTDMQAAVGCAQLEKLPLFTEERKKNWKMILKGLKGLEDIFILPEETPNSDPSWFGFLLTVKENTGVSRKGIVDFLEGRQIQTRMLFAGNMIRHPCFDEMRVENKGYRVVGNLNNTDLIMSNTFWVGVYPGLTKEEIKFVINSIKESVRVIAK